MKMVWVRTDGKGVAYHPVAARPCDMLHPAYAPPGSYTQVSERLAKRAGYHCCGKHK